jgi:hypothetical protein
MCHPPYHFNRAHPGIVHFIPFKASSISIEHLVQAAPAPTPVPKAVIILRADPPPLAMTILASPPKTNPADTYMIPRSEPVFKMSDIAFSDDDAEDWDVTMLSKICWYYGTVNEQKRSISGQNISVGKSNNAYI